ncbi:hypothetical protein ETJ49_25950, partial [Salmonella enterica]|nr:hypothetical protein [Salmonella enterica]
IIFTKENLSEYMYILRLIWLLTDRKIVSDQLKKGISKNQVIEKLKDTVKKSKLLTHSPESIRKRLAESIFFIIEQRVNECGKLK